MNGTYVLKDGLNQIVIEYTKSTFKNEAVADYKKRFRELRKLGKIQISTQFSDINWVLTNKNNKVTNLPFRYHEFPKINMVLKCLAIILLEKGNTSLNIHTQYSLLEKVIHLTNLFCPEKINDFEDYLYECTNSQLVRTIRIVAIFLSYYDLDEVDDYLDLLDQLQPTREDIVRKLPDYKSILIFNYAINQSIWNDDPNEKLKYYPLFLWWRLTGIIPLRPSEFLELDYNCCFKDLNGRFWIKLPRKKVKQDTAKQQIEIVDTIETTSDIYDFIVEYKSLLKSEFQSRYLISYKAYNYFCRNRVFNLRKKKNPEIMGLGSIGLLLSNFYKKKINDQKVVPLKPGDSRHLAFCNLMLQGVNPIAIARLGGHSKLKSQFHYSQHLDTFAESYVFTMADKLKLMQHLKTRNVSGKYESLSRSKLLVTYSLDEIKSFLEIEKGYCIVKTKGCEDFTDCQNKCWFCPNHILDTQKYPEVIKESSEESDKLGHVIKEQTDLLKSISANMFIDYSTEQCSFEGKARLASTAEQLKAAMADKVIIDSKLLDYIKED